jgi:DNA-binding NtrC family response regulator
VKNTIKAEVILTKRGRIYGTLPLEGNIRELENKIERALIMSDDNTISVTEFRPTQLEYTETAEEYPLLGKNAIEKSLIK